VNEVGTDGVVACTVAGSERFPEGSIATTLYVAVVPGAIEVST
jgi:hypothetical protein